MAFSLKHIPSSKLPRERFSQKGFTLIELMVVVTIIGILTAIAISTYSSVQSRARDARRRADINAIAAALEANYKHNDPVPYPRLDPNMFEESRVPLDPQGVGEYQYRYQYVDGTGILNSGVLLQSGLNQDMRNYVFCAKLEALSGGNAADFSGTTINDGPYYCRKSRL